MTEPHSIPTSYIGDTWLRVTRLAFGCVPLGNYPTVLSDAEADAALHAAWDAGIRYFDVAPLYGHGLAEHRLGAFLRNKSMGDFVTSTKVGRKLVPDRSGKLTGDQAASIFERPLSFSLTNDYSYDGIMRSVEDSLQRLGLPGVDILHIHNIDPANHAPDALEALFSQCMTDGYRALDQLRSEGTVKALGVGNNYWTMAERFAAEGDFDCFMMAGHFNLLDQGALDRFLPECQRRNQAVLLGSPFASGLLVADNPEQALHMYRKPAPEIVAKVRSIHAICADHGVSPVAAALQFPLIHPAVACVVPGMRTADEVNQCAAAFQAPLPASLFPDLASAGIIDARLIQESQD